MKKIIAISLILVLVLSIAACGKEEPKQPESSAQSQSNVYPTNEEGRQTVTPVEGTDDLAIAVLSDYVDETLKQKDYDALVAKNGWTSATVEEDGSVTYIMSEEKRQEQIKTIKEDAKKYVADLVPSAIYPNFTSIDANEEFTKFTIHCSKDTCTIKEFQIMLKLYAQSGLWNSFNGTAGRKCQVVFLEDATGNVIYDTGYIL